MALLGDRAGERHVDTLDGVDGDLGQPLGLGGGDLFDLHAALDRAHGQVGAVGAVEQEGDVVLLRDVAGLGDQQLLHDVALDVQAEDVLRVLNASSAVAAYFTPPALPRPPTLTCALTMTGLPISSAIALASSAVVGHPPGVVGTLCLANSSFAWYSKRSMGSLSVEAVCFDFECCSPTGSGELYRHGSSPSAPPTGHVADLTGAPRVIQVTILDWNTPRVATNIGIWLTSTGLDNVPVTTRRTFQVGGAPFVRVSSGVVDERSQQHRSIPKPPKSPTSFLSMSSASSMTWSFTTLPRSTANAR